MNNLPISGQSSYCRIFLSGKKISAVLAYVNYDIEREYVLTDNTVLSKEWLTSDIEFLKQLLFDYFKALEFTWGWKLFDQELTVYSSRDIYTVQKFKTEGLGVNGLTVYLDQEEPYFENIFNAIRELFPSMKLDVDTDNRHVMYYEYFLHKNYKQVLILDLNLFDFDIFHYQYAERKNVLANLGKELYEHRKYSFKWESVKDLVNVVNSRLTQAFTYEDLATVAARNDWANYVLNFSFIANSKYTESILFSFILAQLLSLFNEHKEILQNFSQEKADRKLIVVRGDLLNTIQQSKLFMTLIDGLQLEGVFDVIIDDKMVWSATVDRLMSNTDKIASTLLRENFFDTYMFLIPSSSKKTRKNAISLEAKIAINNDNDTIYGLADKFVNVNTSKYQAITLKWLNGFSLLGQTTGNISLLDEKYKGVLFDLRLRPVVYDGNYVKLADNLKQWIENV